MKPKRHLGGTGIEVTPIGLGTWQFSEGKGGAIGTWSPVPPGETDAIVQAALEGGIRWFDTAELYGFGRSERGLARALLKAGMADGQVVIATKWNPLLRTAGSIRHSIDARLQCLAPFGIDLHQVHFPASFSSIEAEMDAMADLMDAGKIRAAGVSNYSARQMRRAHAALVKRGFTLASNQVKYSVLDRRIEQNGTLDAARELGITIIAYSPLEMGLLSGKFHKNPELLQRLPFVRRIRLARLVVKSRPLVEALERIAAAHGVSASQVALNWLVNFHGETVVTIPGATRVQQARECAGAMDFVLTPGEMAEIERLSRSRQFKSRNGLSAGSAS
jgi:aryl-alcohol dehydrogenase-like predicted oxidoreductase